MKSRISVIIVAWNAEAFLGQCLASVFAQTGVDCEVIVVDNHSQDTTPEILKSYQDRLLLVRNDANRGFCAANNQGISRATGELILTLNSDVILAPDYARLLQRFLVDHPNTAMAQGKLLRFDGVTIDSLGLALSAAKRLFDSNAGEPDGERFNQPREIFGPCAAAALYRRDALEAVHDRHG